MNSLTVGLKQRVALAALEVGFVIAVLYFLGYRDWLFIGAIAGAIAIAALSPPRYSGIVSGVCLLALAALFHLHFKMERLPLVLGAVGIIFLVYGILKLRVLRPRS